MNTGNRGKMIETVDATPCGAYYLHTEHKYRKGFFSPKEFCDGGTELTRVKPAVYTDEFFREILGLSIPTQDEIEGLRNRIDSETKSPNQLRREALLPELNHSETSDYLGVNATWGLTHKHWYRLREYHPAGLVSWECRNCGEEIAIEKDHVGDVLMRRVIYTDDMNWGKND